jgi:hypothetical protein
MTDKLTLIRQITRLARSGAIDRAWAMLEATGLAVAEDDPRALCLRGRLKKDRARRSTGAERVSWLAASAADYLAASKIDGSSYALINAASLSLLAGNRREAASLGGQVLALLDADPLNAETPYWLEATRAEAFLLVDRLADAQAALRKAVVDAPQAYEDRAATIGQFAMICDELRIDADWLDKLRPPRSLYYHGEASVAHDDPAARKSIADWLETKNVGFGFGSLAPGANVWIGEELLRREVELHLVLPGPADEILARLAWAADAAWLPRCEYLLANAASVREVASPAALSRASIDLASAIARGLAIEQARTLQSSTVSLLVAGQVGTSPDGQEQSDEQAIICVPSSAAMSDASVEEQVRLQAALVIAGRSPEVFDSVADAWMTAADRLGHEAGMALDVRLLVSGAPRGGRDWTIAEAMSEQALPGQALASADFAFALLADVPQLRIEPLGDLRSAAGFSALFAVREVRP